MTSLTSSPLMVALVQAATSLPVFLVGLPGGAVADIFDRRRLRLRKGLTPSDDEDTGQTLAVYGVGSGPYLLLPFFPPSRVRDSVGSAVDGLLDPTGFFLPFAGNVATKAETTVNDRSFNLELSEEVEESVLDLSSGVRNFHLQRRERDIRE
jgi:ABC-type transporter lipoprotein component MlaA